jgi:MinD-like ATPase involved in chromosome partitioning or flagellar assembly
MKRILTVSSGKGGVGKTTFAVNFALSLSQYAPTILVDLDTGTSSVRNCLDVPVPRDLYHFLRKGYPLPQCVTPLTQELDPTGQYRNFGFVAGPKHLIDEISNFGQSAKALLIHAINKLPATFVVLDMKAGLDPNVIDFLPYSNSGILVFTPQLPSATLAASDIVKAILFRKLRILFASDSPFYRRVPANPRFPKMINELLDSVEDVYDESIPNLDAFLVDLAQNLGEGPLLDLLRDTIEYFRVFYVLNMFNGIDESYATAVGPFVSNIVEHVSARINVTNLGWIIKSDRIHESNCVRRPILLNPEPSPPVPPPPDAVQREMAALEAQFRSLKVEKPVRSAIPKTFQPADPTNFLAAQLDSLRTMFARQGHSTVADNFRYVTQRSLHLIESMRPSEFGETRVCQKEEILSHFFPLEW